MVSNYQQFLQRHRHIIQLSKYVFSVLLALLAFRIHKELLFLTIALLEIGIVALLTNALLVFRKAIGYIFNVVLLLIINIQNMVMVFGGSFVTLVMVTNLESLDSLGGKSGLIGVGAIVLLAFTFLPVGVFSLKKISTSQALSVILLLDLVMSLVVGNVYSPLFAVYQLSVDARVYQEQLEAIKGQPNITASFYNHEVKPARDKPANLKDHPNIVLIFVEGLSQNIVDDPRQVMPSVQQLQRQSVQFTNYYNHTFATYRGLIGQLYSGYQLDNYDDNTLISLQSLLADSGYQTAFINSEPANTQFTDYVSRFQFQELINEPKKAKGINRSLTDKVALELLYDTIERQHQADQPFFTAMYTYGTHMSFDTADKRLGNTKQPLLDRFYNFDYYFGQFIEKFNKSEMSKDTILVFTTDHATFEDADFKAAYPDYERVNADVDQVPFFIYYQGVQAEEIDAKGRNSLSLTPTILDYIDISGPNYFLGQSLFYYKENNNSYDTVFFDNAFLLSTDYGTISPLEERNEDIVRELLQEYFAAKTQPPQTP